MSDEKYQRRKGIDRALDGSTEEYGLFETNLFDSEKSRAARGDGYAAGQGAVATAEAISRRAASSAASSSETSSWSKSDERGMAVLLMGNPTIAAFAGVAAGLLGAVGVFFGRTAAAAAAKSMGASRSNVERILSADVWTIAIPLGWLAFVATLAYLTINWFKDSENRGIFLESVVAVVVLIALVAGWQYMSSYTAAESGTQASQRLIASTHATQTQTRPSVLKWSALMQDGTVPRGQWSETLHVGPGCSVHFDMPAESRTQYRYQASEWRDMAPGANATADEFRFLAYVNGITPWRYKLTCK